MTTIETGSDFSDFSNTPALEEFIKVGFKETEKRLCHVLEVARRVRETAGELRTRLGDAELDVEEAYRAALLHDVGYLPFCVDTGFHPLDGYHWLVGRGEKRLAQLIVGHSNSPEQAELLGLGPLDISEDLAAKLITYWDVQVLQGGQVVGYGQRLTDIRERYGAQSTVVEAHTRAEPRIRALIAEVDLLLAEGRTG